MYAIAAYFWRFHSSKIALMKKIFERPWLLQYMYCLSANLCVPIMATRSGNESEGSIAALFDEGACLFDNMGSPMEQTPPGVGKTPTTPTRAVDLAATVDGGSGTVCIYSSSSQGWLVSSIFAKHHFPMITVANYHYTIHHNRNHHCNIHGGCNCLCMNYLVQCLFFILRFAIILSASLLALLPILSFASCSSFR